MPEVKETREGENRGSARYGLSIRDRGGARGESFLTVPFKSFLGKETVQKTAKETRVLCTEESP